MPRKAAFPHTKPVRSKGRDYLYFRTGQRTSDGKEILERLPDPRSPQFGPRYASLLGAKTKRRNATDRLTVEGMADLYRRSPKFAKLAPATQRLYGIYLTKLVDLVGNAPAERLAPSDMARMADNMAETPGAANMVLRVTGALYRWGRQRQHVGKHCDPTADIEKLDIGEHQPWPQHVLTAALEADDDRVRLLTRLLYYSGQRLGDVLAMRWSDISTGAIRITQQKTGKDVAFPIHRELAAELDRTPKRGITVVTGAQGRQLNDDTARLSLQSFAAVMGAKVVPHGLRKNAVIALLECGCTLAEVAAITGQSLRMVEHYAKAWNAERLGTAAIIKWQGTKQGLAN